ncbi:alpha/beta hydrolase, partial [Patescibacteria group bacterium]|nr:alpha/beta hydrolase [Patescibacteria group bacterium]
SKYFTVYAIDMPGAGKSQKLSMGFDPEKEIVFIIEKFINKVICEKISILGHSFGGWVSLSLALRKKIKIERLILLDSLGFSNKIPLKHYPLSVPALFPLLKKGPIKKEKVSINNFIISAYQDKKNVDSIFLDYLWNNFSRTGILHPLEFMHNLLDIGRLKSILDFGILLEDIEIPVNIFWGKKDNFIPFNWAVEKIGKLRHNNIKLLPNDGHLLFIENKKDFHQFLLDYIIPSKTI